MAKQTTVNTNYYRILFPLFLLVGFLGVSQETNVVIPDSLKKLDYNTLSRKFYSVLEKNSTLAELYAKVYLSKAKNEKSLKEIAIGYGSIGYANKEKQEYNKSLMYLDSAIFTSKKINHKRYPSIFYINKGQVYEDIGDFKNALDHYIKAIKWCKKTENTHLEFITKQNIGLLKRKLGKYEEAKQLFKECMAYRINKNEMTSKDSLNYLGTLSALVNTYRLNKQIDSASILNEKGFLPSKGKLTYNLFELNRAILKYYDKDYQGVIEDTNTLLPQIFSSDSNLLFETTDLIDTYYYQGKSYEALANEKEAIKRYKKIDSLVQVTNYMIPKVRKAYMILINHYKTIGNKNEQLFYINRLLYADSILDSNYKYLSDKLVNDYDTPELLSEKEKLIEELEAKHGSSSLGVIILSGVVFIVVIFLILSYRKQKRYQQRFEELISAPKKEVLKPAISKTVEEPNSPVTIGISEDIVNSILESLTSFEEKEGYVEGNLTTNSLAGKFGTNSKYLSKVINTYKQKSFIHYINDLRIEFIVEKLKTDTKYRMYTIKALASESGFNTTEAFSKSFYKKTGIYPSYFIKQLEKKQNS